MGRPMPASLRRRVTPVGRKALECAWAVLPESGEPRLVLCSRHGEYGRTFGLLTQIDEEGTASPAEFSLSVHHALAGLLSIATGNRAAHTAVAAGEESFGYGMLEAVTGLMEDGRPAVVMYFDEPPPEIYRPVLGHPLPAAALAVALAPAEAGEGEAMTLAVEPATTPGTFPRSMAADFVDFLASSAPERVSAGERLTWGWRRAA